jgi:hypothetical protein
VHWCFAWSLSKVGIKGGNRHFQSSATIKMYRQAKYQNVQTTKAAKPQRCRPDLNRDMADLQSAWVSFLEFDLTVLKQQNDSEITLIFLG